MAGIKNAQKVIPSEHIGKKYGCLTILEYYKTGNSGVEFYVKCDCGNVFTKRFDKIKNGGYCCIKCMGKYKKKIHHKQLYKTWCGMKYRCSEHKANEQNYKNYYLRGIRVCDEWANNYFAFEKWSLENGYKEEKLLNGKNKLTIDRIDVNGNYEPSNCRWVDVQTQANNTRVNKYITYKGKTQSLADWCRELKLDYNLINNRLFHEKISVEEAFERPKKELLTYNYKGKLLTAKEICEITGLKLSGFYSRLNRNWSIERIVETKVNDYYVNK